MELRRGVPPAMLAAMAGTTYPVLFVHLDWPGAPVFVHSAKGVLTWGGHDWKGVGAFGSISIPDEGGGSMATAEASVTLQASPEDLDAYMDDTIRNREAAFYWGSLTARPGTAGAQLISDPVAVFHGAMDAAGLTFEPDGDNVISSITVGLATGPGARSSASVYHSDQDQARRHSGDTAGRLTALASLRREAITWPES